MSERTLVTGSSGFIGTNLVHALRADGREVVGIDIAAPRDPRLGGAHRFADLLDADVIRDVVAEFAPTHVVHLGARTDLGGTSAEDYRVNVAGSRHLLGAALASPTTRRVVVASSLLVCRNGYVPRSDTDYCPTTAYGESKQRMEEEIRARHGGDPRWVLARPTSIWGPWFGPPYRTFFETVMAGRYVHPGRPPVTKALGYVTNTVFQIIALLDASAGDVAGRTFYLADPPIFTIEDWANAIAKAAGRRRPRRAPLGLLRVVAAVGDLAARSNRFDPPLTSFRLANMRTPSRYDTTAIDALTGELPVPWRDGVARTIAWLRGQS